MRKTLIPLGLCVAAFLSMACGRQFDKLLEEAQFALDSQDYATAITKATEALVATPNDFEATMVLSAAYSGRAGVNLLDLAKKLTESGIEDEAFNAVHDLLAASLTSTGLTDLRSAVTTLSGFAGTVGSQTRYTFQLGMLQAIEGYALPSLTAQPTVAGTITATSVTSAQKDIVQADLIAADNNLITSGIGADNQLVTTVRKSYCVIKERSAGSGFSQAELQDRVRCELDDNRANLRTANGDFQSATVTTCDDFNFTTCTAVDTTS